MLTQLLFCSHSKIGRDSPEMARLVEQCHRNNPTLGLTGVLAFDGAQFLQLLEGEAAAVDAMFARIRADPRHSATRLLIRAPAARRMFSGTDMRFIDTHDFGHRGRAFSYDSAVRASPDELRRRVGLLSRL